MHRGTLRTSPPPASRPPQPACAMYVCTCAVALLQLSALPFIPSLTSSTSNHRNLKERQTYPSLPPLPMQLGDMRQLISRAPFDPEGALFFTDLFSSWTCSCGAALALCLLGQVGRAAQRGAAWQCPTQLEFQLLWRTRTRRADECSVAAAPQLAVWAADCCVRAARRWAWLKSKCLGCLLGQLVTCCALPACASCRSV